MIESQLGEQGEKEFETITAFAAEALGKWTGTLIGTFKIQSAVGNLKILGERKLLGGVFVHHQSKYNVTSTHHNHDND